MLEISPVVFSENNQYCYWSQSSAGHLGLLCKMRFVFGVTEERDLAYLGTFLVHNFYLHMTFLGKM